MWATLGAAINAFMSTTHTTNDHTKLLCFNSVVMSYCCSEAAFIEVF
jgi:hypothetical protein